MIKALLLTITFSMFVRAANQAIFLDVAGKKNGDIEKLYTEEGQRQLSKKITDTLVNSGDSVYFIIETSEFQQAILVNAYVGDDGKWLGGSTAVYRRENATAECSAEKMMTVDIDYRADKCYYEESQYAMGLGIVGSTRFETTKDFLNHVLTWSHLNNPLKSAQTLIDEISEVKAQFKKNTETFKTTKLYSFLRIFTLKQFGYKQNLSESTGWIQTMIILSDSEKKLAAAIDKLFLDDKIYLSKNVSCPVEAQIYLKTSFDAPGRIVVKNEFTLKCEGMTLMGEHLDQIFETMQLNGYTYNNDTKDWN